MTADSSIFVVVLGLATTFVGLICIIFLSKIMSFFCQLFTKGTKAKSNSAVKASQPAQLKGDVIPNRGEFVAAISAAIAEDLGKDISTIRILSIKKI